MQKRVNLQEDLRKYRLYATTEEHFHRSLGISCSGWEDEYKMALAVVDVKMYNMEQSKHARLQRIEAIHHKLTERYEKDLAKWSEATTKSRNDRAG